MFLLIFERFYFYLFSERGKGGRKRQRETSMCKRNISWLLVACLQPGTWPTMPACALTGNRTGDLLDHRLMLNALSHTSQCVFIDFLERGGDKGERNIDVSEKHQLVASLIPPEQELNLQCRFVP